MPDTTRLSHWNPKAILPGVMVIALLLCCAGCLTTSQDAPKNGVSPDNTPGETGEQCTFDLLAELSERHLTQGDACYFNSHTPAEFLNDLRKHPGVQVMVLDVPRDWITHSDVEHLMQEIDSTAPAAPVVSPLSSYRPFNQTSTAGNEALYLIEGYRAGKYPPALCSLHYFHPDKDEVQSWWETYGRWNYPEEREAIRLIKEAYPDLKGYPADTFPVKSIRTERAPDGWYVAFIQEGSGVPIISARCYCVGNDRSVMLMGTANQSVMVMVPEFSPKTCR